MVMPALADRFWTPEDILALLDDGARHECIEGVHLVTPTPRMDHQRVAMALARRLQPYAESVKLGEVFALPGDLRLERTDVGEYWIVDADARVVERWRAGDARPEILSGSMIWQPMPEASGLTIDLDALFAEVLGDDDAATPSPPASAAPG